ncbi:MAG: S41 family peptidase [Acidimicrobiales bacterium]
MPGSLGYLRSPTIAGDTIAFVTEDDLWTVPATGGTARRLTASSGTVGRPRLSPDGRWLAYTSTDEHHTEAWVMPADGGEARRITWLGANTTTRAWTPEGRVLVATDARQPFAGDSVLATGDPAGGPVAFLGWGQATDAAFGPDGARVLGRFTVDPARWKRYRGGRAGRLWTDPGGTGEWRPLLPGFNANLADPMFVGDRVWFVADHEGIGNLYSCRPDGEDLRRETDHEVHYARLAATDGRRIVYQHAADIWILEPGAGPPRPIDIELHSPRSQRRRRFVDASTYLRGAALHPSGHSVIVETRGKLFTLGLFEGAVRAVGADAGARYRLGRWLGDGSAVICVSDASGEDVLEVHPVAGAADEIRTLPGLDLGRITALEPSPADGRVAVLTHRQELVVVDTGSGTTTTVDRSTLGPITDPVWSPDGRWLAYSSQTTQDTRSIMVAASDGSRVEAVTRAEFVDFAPAWDPDGNYLFLLSARVFNPVNETAAFAYGFPKGTRPYLITLAADRLSPFLRDPRPPTGAMPVPAVPPAAAPPDAASAEGPARPDVVIDFDGIADRIIPIGVGEGRHRQIVALAGKVLVVGAEVEGVLGGDPFGQSLPPASLDVVDLDTAKTERLAGGVSWITVSADRSTLVYAAGNRLRAVAAGAKPPEGDEPVGRDSGWIDLGRIRVDVDPGREWLQMFEEAWRLQRDHFWVPDLSGVDWDAVRERYRPLVERVATRIEFSDLMWEMLGELGTSHAYEIGGDHRAPPPYVMASLGADIDLAADGRWRVSRRLVGDPWDEASAGPLASPGSGVEVGDAVVAINGLALGESGPGPLLVHQAGSVLDLEVEPAAGGERRTVRVRSLGDDRPVRYRDWVNANRAAVHRASDGRCGYLHVPNMGAQGYAEFHRSWGVEIERDAVVVDVRHNGGGNVSSLLLEKLAQRRLAYVVTRWHGTESYPYRSPNGPMVCLTDESAGSDGDIFSHAWKMLGLGPLVGKRTWGGVIGINPSHVLADGSITTQPEFSFWFTDVGWGVENYGTDPDHEVDIRPQDHEAGVDPQLDTAVRLVLEALSGHESVRPPADGRPRLVAPPLPAREPLS